MRTIHHKGAAASVLAAGVLVITAIILAGCDHGTIDTGSGGALAPFRHMAATSSCADVRNRLFLIDRQLVFWDRAGNCADMMYAETLYGQTTEDVLCVFADSIDGPHKQCTDPTFASMFDTIIGNLDDPQLGLGPDHLVQKIPI